MINKSWFKFKCGLFLSYCDTNFISIILRYFLWFFVSNIVFCYYFSSIEFGYFYPFADFKVDFIPSYSFYDFVSIIDFVIISLLFYELLFHSLYLFLKHKDKNFYDYIQFKIYRKKVFKEKKTMNYLDYQSYLLFKDKVIFYNEKEDSKNIL